MGVLIARLRESFAVFNFKNHCFGLLLLSQALTCVSASCTPPEIPHSLTSHSSEPVLSSDRLKIVCDFAYRLVGSAYITCQEDGTWSASYGSLSFPQCVPVESSKCSRPIIPNGKVLNPNIIDHREHPSWSEEEVVCDGGFKLVGTPFIVCKNGHWSAAYGSAENFPVCTEMQRKRCLPISHNDNVVVKYEIELKNATAYCKAGYHMDMRAPASLICERGQWLGRFPRCWKHCPPISVIPNTVVKYSLDRANATIYCKKGYHMEMRSPAHLYCHLGQWEGMVPECRKLCPAPPEIPFANVQYYKENPVDGAKVTYHCNNGYSMDNQSLAELTCRDGEWPGKLPTCIYRCDPPEEIANGHWEEVGGAYPYTKIKYRCNRHFRAQGPSLLWCQEDHTWSHIPPQCLPDTDPVVYCASPPNLSHGECTCAGRAQSYCEPFRPGMRWVCRCDDGYMLGGAEAITCNVAGEWSNNMPTCLPVDSQVNTAGPVQEGSHISTLAIVVATACSVLGVLLLVMVAVIFRRHKPRPRLYHATPAPPPYTRVHSNSVDEHDRVALIAYAEGRQPTLPTYDEATRGMPSVGTSPHTHSVVNMGSGEAGLAGQQYRPLPPIPPTLRGTAPTTTAQSAADNNNRHSTATTSTVHNRDGFSEVFGSLDTVNVSISDASTAGTTETVDSGASNPSLASRRANAGSLGSSNGSLATDDAPLLESGHDGRIMSTSSEPLPEEDKEE